MKTQTPLRSMIFASALLGAASIPCLAGTGDGGGSPVARPLLEKVFQPGNFVANWHNRECRVFAAGVDLLQDGSFVGSKPFTPSHEVASTDQIEKKLQEAQYGPFHPKATVPDIGRARYTGNIMQDPFSVQSVVLLDVNYDGSVNESPAATELVELLDLNCQFE